MNLDDGDDVYNWPWLYAVRPGDWKLTDAQAAKLRDYLLRGGFFMADDFWGRPEWDVFMAQHEARFPRSPGGGPRKRRPDFPHRLRSRRPLSGARARGASTAAATRTSGRLPAHWRGIYDDKGRVMVAMTPQLRSGRFLGVGRLARIPGELLRARNSHRRELHRLRDDALSVAPDTPHTNLFPA